MIAPSATFVATAAAVRYCEAQPVFSDVAGPRTPLLDAISEALAAVVA